MESYRDNLEIDLKDLALKILKNWKAILIAAVLCAILSIGYTFTVGGYIPSLAESLPKEITLDEYKDMIIANLSPKEIKDVELLYNAYQECERLYTQTEISNSEKDAENKIELLKATQQVIAAKSYLSNDQHLYFLSLFEEDGDNISNAFIKKVNSQYKLNEGAHTGSSKNFPIKYVFLASILGAFIVIIIVSLKYITNPVLKTSEELRTAFKLPIISSFRSENEDVFSYVFSSILAVTKSISANKIYLLSASSDALTAEIKQKISGMFDEEKVSVISDSILENPESLNSVVDSDGVILFEKIGQSKYDDISREIELCTNLGVKILGSVAIE